MYIITLEVEPKILNEQKPNSIYIGLHQGSQGHEKSWEMKIGLPGLEKSRKIDKWRKVMEKSWNLRFP